MMDCSEVQERLSAFVDRELPESDRDAVAMHLQACAECVESVEFTKALSEQTRLLADPIPPADLWAGIESRLRHPAAPGVVSSVRKSRNWGPMRYLALAASIFVAAGVGFWASHSHVGDHGHETMAANFDLYLAKFSVDPDRAHEMLLTTYGGEQLAAGDIEKRLGYQPLAAQFNPAGATAEQIYVLDMPCCRCALTICRRGDGGVLAVLEHDEPQPIWFGDRPRVECLCDGKPTSVVQVNGKLAASWRQGSRHITVIGAGDLEEVTQIVAGFGGEAGA